MIKLNLNICSWNIQGSLVNKCKHMFFLNLIKSYDIVCIQESWLKTNDQISIPGYSFFRSDRKQNKSNKRGHGGIVTFFKNNLKAGITKINSNNSDILWMKLSKTFFGLNQDLYLASCYIPPADSFVHKEYDIFDKLNNDIIKYKTLGETMIVGDLNSRIGNNREIYVQDFLENQSKSYHYKRTRTSQDLSKNSNGNKLIEIINSNNLIIANGRKIGDTSGAVTCIKYNGSSVVDYCISDWNLYDHITSFSVKDFTHISDHCPIVCSLKCVHGFEKISSGCKKGNKVKYVYKYMWDNDAKQKFIEVLNSDITKIKLNAFMENKYADSNLASKDFQQIITYVADNSLKKVKCRNKKHFNLQFDNECILFKKDFYKKVNDFKRNSDKQDKRIKMLIARSMYRRKINYLKDLAKQNKVNKLQGLDRSDPKQFWNTIKSMINSNLNDSCDISNDQWVDYFSKLLNNNTNSAHCNLNDYIFESLNVIENASNTINNELNTEINSTEVIKTIKDLKCNKAAGIDGITNDMLKSGSTQLISPMLHLYNTILYSGVFPESWNCALITPIHKKNDKSDPNNYRGIAVANCISKVFIKILTKRIDKHMSENNFWSKHQNGFKSGMRTEDNLFILKSIITDLNIKKKQPLYTCFVDFSKFFDTLNRDILFYKLQKYNITGNIYKFIKSMYSNCVYAIKTNNTISDSFNSSIGVKQGCPLSPILSNIFQNDLHDIFDDSCNPIKLGDTYMNSLSWADDLVLMSTSKNGLQNALNKLQTYCQNWGLSVNVSKTKSMVFGKGKIDFR